jgi:hypothetical protein
MLRGARDEKKRREWAGAFSGTRRQTQLEKHSRPSATPEEKKTR